jgi:hypothetical protein
VNEAMAAHMADCDWCFGHSYCVIGEELLKQRQGTPEDCWAERDADRVLAGLR